MVKSGAKDAFGRGQSHAQGLNVPSSIRKGRRYSASAKTGMKRLKKYSLTDRTCRGRQKSDRHGRRGNRRAMQFEAAVQDNRC